MALTRTACFHVTVFGTVTTREAVLTTHTLVRVSPMLVLTIMMVEHFLDHNARLVSFINRKWKTAKRQKKNNALDVKCRSLNYCVVNFFATGNIGIGKNASQTGTLGAFAADRALDGRTAGSYTGYCAYAYEPSGTNAYWTVDLGKRHQILNITIYRWLGKIVLNVLLITRNLQKFWCITELAKDFDTYQQKSQSSD